MNAGDRERLVACTEKVPSLRPVRLRLGSNTPQDKATARELKGEGELLDCLLQAVR